MSTSLTVTAFYKFCPLAAAELKKIQADLAAQGEALGIYGLVLLATEGINGTVAGPADQIAAWEDLVKALVGDVAFKRSGAEQNPFKRFFVKIRPEIVALGNQEVVPAGPNNHLTPSQWDEVIANEDAIILDARNTYETEIGIFEGAIDPRLEQFSDFPKYVTECQIPKDKKVLMYCTGGIRCEKAALEMQRQGYQQVYQLEGGILKYLEEKPNGRFKGECFVFDHRTAVNAKLEASARYHLCPHCGDPGDQAVTCNFCKQAAVICKKCEPRTKSCSKNCAHHLKIGSQARSC